MTQAVASASSSTPQRTSPVRVRKLGHVVYRVSDLDRSVKFYTEILNFRISDTNELGMVFLTACGDHHTVALMPVRSDMPDQPAAGRLGLHHFAMEVATLDDLFEVGDFLREMNVPITFEGRRGAGCNTGVEFTDPDGTASSCTAAWTRWAPATARARPSSGTGRGAWRRRGIRRSL